MLQVYNLPIIIIKCIYIAQNRVMQLMRWYLDKVYFFNATCAYT